MRPALTALLAAATVVVLLAVVGVAMGGPPESEHPAPSGAALAASKQRIAQGNATVREGAEEFEEEGCDACHAIAATGADGHLGPRLDTLADDDVDEIAESIAKPREDVEEGYEGNLMPRYADRMDRGEIRAVATFLKAASGDEE